MSFWKRLLHSLSHHADRERVERARRGVTDAIESVPGFTQSDRDEWIRVATDTLFHQGEPRAHVVRLIGVLARGESVSWDEASYDVEGDRVVITFVNEIVEVDRARLLTWLERVRVALDRL